jgi:hypothetical protein
MRFFAIASALKRAVLHPSFVVLSAATEFANLAVFNFPSV